MTETERAEFEAAYDAVVAMLEVADTVDFRFRVATMGETRWILLQKGAPGTGTAEYLGVESLELARCSSDLAHAVFRRVLGIALTPVFSERCLNREDDFPEIDGADPRCVIYLAKYRAAAPLANVEDQASPDARVTVSGMRPKVGKSKSA